MKRKETVVKNILSFLLTMLNSQSYSIFTRPSMSAGEKSRCILSLGDGRMQAEDIITNLDIVQILNDLSVTG
jgi:hypothetical protein